MDFDTQMLDSDQQQQQQTNDGLMHDSMELGSMFLGLPESEGMFNFLEQAELKDPSQELLPMQDQLSLHSTQHGQLHPTNHKMGLFQQSLPLSTENLSSTKDGSPIVADTPTPIMQDDYNQFYQNDALLNELNWDMGGSNLDNLSVLYPDSATLASESRTSYEFRTSSEFFDSLSMQPQPMDNDPQNGGKSRFSITSIFKSNNNSNSGPGNSRFTLRSINPLSTHREVPDLVQTLPNVSEEAGEEGVKEFTNSPVKKKKTTTSSLVSALANARLGFSSSKNQQASSSQPEITVTKEGMETPMKFEFDEELTRVISMASMNSSSYNFNQLVESREKDKIDEKEEGGEEGEGVEKHSPDYGALFSDMKAVPKKSKLSSFRRMVPGGGSSTPDEMKAVEGKSDRAEVKSLKSLKSEKSSKSDKSEKSSKSELKLEPQGDEVILPPLPEGASLPIIAPENEPVRRGRKPTLEYDATKQFVCSFCLRRFRRQEHLKRHIRSLHTNEKPFDCTVCGKKFSRADNMAQHMKMHADEH